VLLVTARWTHVMWWRHLKFSKININWISGLYLFTHWFWIFQLHFKLLSIYNFVEQIFISQLNWHYELCALFRKVKDSRMLKTRHRHRCECMYHPYKTAKLLSHSFPKTACCRKGMVHVTNVPLKRKTRENILFCLCWMLGTEAPTY
jgi:hypothetical protein